MLDRDWGTPRTPSIQPMHNSMIIEQHMREIVRVTRNTSLAVIAFIALATAVIVAIHGGF